MSVLKPLVDDIIFASKEVKLHLLHLELVLESVRTTHMALSAKKMLQYSVKYCDRLIDERNQRRKKKEGYRHSFEIELDNTCKW